MTDLIAELAEVGTLFDTLPKDGAVSVTMYADAQKAQIAAANLFRKRRDEIEAMARDAELWRRTIDNTGDGLRVVVWNKRAPDDMDVLFPSPNLLKNAQYIDQAMHDSAREDSNG